MFLDISDIQIESVLFGMVNLINTRLRLKIPQTPQYFLTLLNKY